MKTQHNSTPLRVAQVAGVLVLTGWMAGQTAFAGHGHRCQPCRLTAKLAYQADLGAAQSDYIFEVGKALNFNERDDRREASREARSELRETRRHARAVLGARRDLCELLDEYRYDPEIDPDEFLSPAETAANPNPYLPLVPGTVKTYESETDEGTETIVVEVGFNTVEIMGIECIEVRDTVSLGGDLVEDTLDWYAQHEDGSVWYLGEISLNYEDGQLADLEGSWKADEDGAKPGIVMLGDPQEGDAYRQEWLLGEAEDAAEVVAVGETIEVRGVIYSNCVVTQDINPNDPELIEFKYFAPGVGFVYEIKPEDGETVELIP